MNECGKLSDFDVIRLIKAHAEEIHNHPYKLNEFHNTAFTKLLERKKELERVITFEKGKVVEKMTG